MRAMLIGIAAVLLLAPRTEAAELRIAPGDSLVLNRANGRGHFDVVLHAAALATGPGETLTLKGLRIEVMSGGVARMSRTLTAEEVVADTRGMAQAGFPEAVDAQVLTVGGLPALFGRPLSLGAAPVMAPSTALVAARRYLALDFQPDSLRVTAEAIDAGGRPVEIAAIIPVKPYSSPITYESPVQGVWLQQAMPTLQSHHRLNPPSEFALDFFRIDAGGDLYRGGDNRAGANAYAYGAPVLAAADGVVVSVVDDEAQDRAAMLRRPDETPQAAGERIGGYMAGRMARDFRRAAGGNLIVIRHEAGAVVEYSAYGHLKTGSARVRPGDRVVQGQPIAEVGDTGDSAAVHLHFQVNAGADPFTSKSLPVRLSDIAPVGGNTELGRIVATRP